MSNTAQNIVDFNPGAQKRPPDAKRCQHTKGDGSRCQNWATKYGVACSRHAKTLAPELLEQGRQKLSHLVDTAINVLYEILTNPLEEGKVRATVAKNVLDRSGLGPHQTMNVNRNEGNELPFTVDFGKFKGRKLEELTGEEFEEFQEEHAKRILEHMKPEVKEARAKARAELNAKIDALSKERSEIARELHGAGDRPKEGSEERKQLTDRLDDVNYALSQLEKQEV